MHFDAIIKHYPTTIIIISKEITEEHCSENKAN
jgi:hypothetical protein